MPISNTDPIDLIKRAFLELEKKEGASLRDFSRFLEIHPSTLSKILAKQRGIPKSLAGKLAEKLVPIEADRPSFIQSVLEQRAKKKSTSSVEEMILAENGSLDMFYIISQWEYFAILNVLGLKTFDHSFNFIADSLNLSLRRVKECMGILERNGLVQHKGQKIIRKIKKLNTTNEISSRAIRLAHLEELELAKNKINVPLEFRYYQSNTVKIASKDIGKVKRLIDRMNAELNKLTAASEPEEIYMLNCQFFPLSQKLPTKKETIN
jgi:uncharacterized protein (TIGR02147 family)